MIIEAYHHDDLPTISGLFTATFTAAYGKEEGDTVGQLAEALLTGTAPSDLHCFVGREESEIISAIIFTRLSTGDNRHAFILSPLAVSPNYQKRGQGQALINHGLGILESLGAEWVMTYGDPDYYGKTGFKPIATDLIIPPYTLSQPEGWIGRGLGSHTIPTSPCECQCVGALQNPAHW